MSTLVLECSGPAGSVAIVSDAGEPVFSEQFHAPRGRGGAMFESLHRAMKANQGFHRVLVGLGPGSYNGLRMAAAAGFGIAATRQLPLLGLSSLCALNLDARPAVIVGDARGGTYFFARVTSGALLDPPELFFKETILNRLTSSDHVIVQSPISWLPQAVVAPVQAALLGKLVASAHSFTGIPEPLYLKPAFITEAKRAWKFPFEKTETSG